MKLFFSLFSHVAAAKQGTRSLSRDRKQRRRWLMPLGCALIGLGLTLSQLFMGGVAVAQKTDQGVQQQENQLIKQFTLPPAPPPAPVYRPQPAVEAAPEVSAPTNNRPAPEAVAPSQTSTTSQAQPKNKDNESKENATAQPISEYVLELNRSPAIGNRFRLKGVHDEASVSFTRPSDWKIQSAKAYIRYQHSPALLASHSNLMVRVNDTSIGSKPLNLKQSQAGEFVVDIPPKLLQDANTITFVAQQNNAPGCSNPADPNLWTEVLSDSKLVFKFQPQPVPLDFSRYPYPFFDELSLDANRISYLPPTRLNEAWLTAAARFETNLGRQADYRPLETRLVKDIDQLQWNDRLAVIGTPAEQPLLKSLTLPFTIGANQLLDGSKKAFPGDVGILMLTTAPKNGVPVLVATGNGPEGVAKAVQFLVQPQNGAIGTGQAIIVSDLGEVSSPDPRQWSRYLPIEDSFKLSDLKTEKHQPFQDVTVRGASAAPIEFDFRALPDDRFERGSSMLLVYSYGPQVNPRTSAVDVSIDGVGIGGRRLAAADGGNRETLKVNLPENLVKPDSKIQVSFRLSPKDLVKCGVATDQQLWGTVHNDTSFNLKRTNSVQLPNLKLLQTGFPFTAPQDLSRTAIVLPDAPSKADMTTLLNFSERMGRLSQANSVKVDVYTSSTLPATIKAQRNLVGIGIREKFPFPEVFRASGFRLQDVFARQWKQAKIQTLPDSGGVVKEIISPWNPDRVLLALTGQTENGLNDVHHLLTKDPWFYQLRGDTVLVSVNQANPSPYDTNAYRLQFLEQAEPHRIENTNLLNKVSRFFQDNWFLLPTGIVTLCLLLYGLSQLLLKRVAGDLK